MKNIISITFDDGRADNYAYAWQVMEKYGLTGTFFVTTGYIDKTWQTDKWCCSSGGMSVEQLIEMHNNGCEIAAHGNRHVSEIGDIDECISKLKTWGVVDKKIGLSAPCSLITDSFLSHVKKLGLSYLRLGRGIKCSSLFYRFIHKIYKVTGSQIFFDLYYKECINRIDKIDPWNILALPLLREDDVEPLIQFIRNQNNKWIILMFHSILPENDRLYGTDDYCWSMKKFEKLCAFLKEEKIKTANILDMVEHFV